MASCWRTLARLAAPRHASCAAAPCAGGARAFSVRAPRVAELLAWRPPPAGVPVDVTGWVRSARFQKQYSFLEVNDGTSARSLQVVWRTDGLALQTAQRSRAGTGSCVRVRGLLVPSPKPGQPVEVQAIDVSLLGGTDADTYPLQKKAHSPEFLREMVHLRPRLSTPAAILRMRHTLAAGALAHLDAEGFIGVTTPVLTSNDCEGGGELFGVEAAAAPTAAALLAAAPVPGGMAVTGAAPPALAPIAAAAAPPAFFGKPVFLTVSGQLHLEAFAVGLGRVYAWGPTFRAENSHTARHAAEFWMLEPEIAPGTMDDAVALAEGVVRAAARRALADRGDDLTWLSDRLKSEAETGDAAMRSADAGGGGGGSGHTSLVARLERATAPAAFARMTFCEALAALASSGRTFAAGPATWAGGLATEHERFLAEALAQGPVFVTDYPAHLKPFYMRSNDDDDGTGGGGSVAAFDLLVPGVGELAGGSAREERPLRLGQRMAAQGLLSPAMAAAVAAAAAAGGDIRAPAADTDAPNLDWYLDTRRYGGVPHAGFGLGFDRLVMWATGTDNIRDVLPVPRVPGSCRL